MLLFKLIYPFVNASVTAELVPPELYCVVKISLDENCTSPLIKVETYNEIIDSFDISFPEHDSVNTVSEMKEYLYLDEKPLNFDPNRLITGVNIVDDMLFWTDNFSEPKKINIDTLKLNNVSISSLSLIHI